MLPNFADNLTHQVQSPFTYTPLHFPAVTFHHPTISDNDYRSINNPDETCGLRVRSDWWTSTGQPRGIPRFPLHVQISKKKKFETSQFVKKFCFQQPHVRSFLTDKYQHTWFYTKTYGFKSCRVLKLHPPAVSKRDLVFSTLVNVTSLPPTPRPQFSVCSVAAGHLFYVYKTLCEDCGTIYLITANNIQGYSKWLSGF